MFGSCNDTLEIPFLCRNDAVYHSDRPRQPKLANVP